MKLSISLFFAFVLVVCGTAKADPVNLVTNGSFEQGTLNIGSFQGWTTNLGDMNTYVDSSGQTGPHYGQASNGLWAAYFGTPSASGGASISQTLNTVANQMYTLTFDLANDNGGEPASNDFAVYIDGKLLFSFAELADQDYVSEQFSFLATDAATTLEFDGFNDLGYTELDNVVVNAAATPEPSEIVLLGTGLLGVAGIARKRFSR